MISTRGGPTIIRIRSAQNRKRASLGSARPSVRPVWVSCQSRDSLLSIRIIITLTAESAAPHTMHSRRVFNERFALGHKCLPARWCAYLAYARWLIDYEPCISQRRHHRRQVLGGEFSGESIS